MQHPPAAPDAASAPRAHQCELPVDHRRPTSATEQEVSESSLLLAAGIVVGVLGAPAASAGDRTAPVDRQQDAAPTAAGWTAPPAAPAAAEVLPGPGHFDRHGALKLSGVVAARDADEPQTLDRRWPQDGPPRPSGVETLQGGEGLRRVRAGDYRIIYTRENATLTVLVVTIGHRRDVYRRR